MLKINKEGKLILIGIAVFLIALLPRLLLAISSHEIPSKDAAGYDRRGMDILEGKGFLDEDGKITAMDEPFYSFFLTAVYYFFGHNYMAARIIQAILGAITCVIIFLIARMFFNLPVD